MAAFAYLTYGIMAFTVVAMLGTYRTDIVNWIKKKQRAKNEYTRAVTEADNANIGYDVALQNKAVKYLLSLKAPNGGAVTEDEILKSGKSLLNSDVYKSIYKAGLTNDSGGQNNS